MSQNKIKTTPKGATPTKRKAYERPAFMPSLAFERQALSCAGCLNASAGVPSFCSLNS